MNVSFNEQEAQALLSLLNIGMKNGAFDLGQAGAVSHIAQKIEEAFKPKQEETEEV